MHLYGLIIGISIVIGLNYFEKHQSVIPRNRLVFFEIGLLISALIGARAYHVVDQWSYYSLHPELIPQTWNGGVGIFGGILGGLVFIIFFAQSWKIEIISLLNCITPILPLCQAIGRLGNWINQENPIWWPEAIGNLVLYQVIHLYPKNPTGKYLLGYGLIRLVTEHWRQDTWTINTLKVGQLIAIMMILIGLWLIQKPQTTASLPRSGSSS